MSSLSLFFGRILLALIFLMSGVNKLTSIEATAEKMTDAGIPLAGVLVYGAILFLLLGSVSLILGFRTRTGAIMLMVFLALATWFFHDFWTLEDAARRMQTIQFTKNLSIFGGLLVLVGAGPGRFSIDGWSRAGRPELTSYDYRAAAGRKED